MGCIVKQGAVCSQTQEKCPNRNGNHITFTIRRAKKAEATREARERMRREPAGRTTQTAGPSSEANTSALGLRARATKGGGRGGSDKKMADAEGGGAEAEDVTMLESMTQTTTAMLAPSTTETVMATGTGIEPKNRMGVAAPNVSSDPTQLS